MPTYQYACTACDHAFEQVQSFSEDSLTVCPTCQGRLRKVYNAVGVVFKGSGFYKTDSRDAGKAAGKGKEAPTPDAGGTKEAVTAKAGDSSGAPSDRAASGSSKPSDTAGSSGSSVGAETSSSATGAGGAASTS